MAAVPAAAPPHPPPHPRPRGFARDLRLAAAIWIPLWLVQLGSIAWHALEAGQTVPPLVLHTAVDFGWMIVVTPLVFRVCERWPLAGRRARRRHVAVHAVICLLLVPSALLGKSGVVFVLTGLRPEVPSFVAVTASGMTYLYLLAAGIGTAMHLRRQVRREEVRARALADELARLELGDLHGRLRPELFFDTLRAVDRLIPDDPAAADRLVARMGVFLRHSLDAGGRAETGWADEMAATTAFLDVVSLQRGGGVARSVTADAEAMGAAVPPLLLHPVLAEVFRHPHGPGARVRVHAAAEGDALRVEARVRGFALPAGAEEAPLDDLRRRLLHLHGPGARVDAVRDDGGELAVVLHVPAGGALAGPILPTLHPAAAE